jgi:hypothetical protein
LPLLAQVKNVVFRDLVEEIPSTTFATFGLYNYPAKFIPQVISYVLKEYARTGDRIFDPFAGYGTVGVVSRLSGFDYELWDLNPMLEHLHKVATMKRVRGLNPGKIAKEMSESREEFNPQWSKVSYWFPDEVLPFLYRVWGYYHSLKDSKTKDLLLIPLLKSTRKLSYNDAGRQKLSKSPLQKNRVDELLKRDWKSIFLESFELGINLVNKKQVEFESLHPMDVDATCRGGVDITKEDLEKPADVLITSPPYLQAQEYLRYAKLDLFWLGYSEEEIKKISSREIPYGKVDPSPIFSDTYLRWRDTITEERLRRLYDKYFWGVLGSLSRLGKSVRSKLCLFVAPANIRGKNVPLPEIFLEHFESSGWSHETTLIDTIVARRLFRYGANPATGINDNRMSREHMIIMSRRK